MVSLTSAWYFGIVVAISVVRRFVPRAFDAPLFVGGAALAFLVADWRPGVALFGVVAYSFVAAHVIARWRAAFVPALAVLLAGFLASFWIADARPDIDTLPLVGLPYLALRAVVLFDDVRQGLAPPGPGTAFAYLLPVHQVLAGPVERFSEFREKWTAPVAPLTPDTWFRGLDRITDGLVKKLVVCELLVQTFGFRFEATGPQLALEIAAHALWFYLDFSGYMDIVLGMGIWLGWVPPENFDWPYLSRNLVVFWTRWHITLGTFIRDRVFNPANVALQRGWLRGRPLLAGITCYFLSMVFCGLWHRPSPQFLVWGLLHGLGIAVFKLWEAALLKRLGRPGVAKYNQHPVIRWVSTAVTFSFVAASFLFAVRAPGEAVSILSRLLP
jgi:alginate O-acetyltransferase complex protein AlgI